MAITLVTEPVHEYECDGCGATVIATDSETPPKGLHGEVFEDTGISGNGGKFWACSRKCLRKAVITAIERDY